MVQKPTQYQQIRYILVTNVTQLLTVYFSIGNNINDIYVEFAANWTCNLPVCLYIKLMGEIWQLQLFFTSKSTYKMIAVKHRRNNPISAPCTLMPPYATRLSFCSAEVRLLLFTHRSMFKTNKNKGHNPKNGQTFKMNNWQFVRICETGNKITSHPHNPCCKRTYEKFIK